MLVLTSKDNALDKTTRINALYDFYHRLLTDKQREYMELYYQDDLSLGEIAEQKQISRQAVNEHLKRVEHLLEQYEQQLQLVSKYDQQEGIIDQLSMMINEAQNINHGLARQLLKQLNNLD